MSTKLKKGSGTQKVHTVVTFGANKHVSFGQSTQEVRFRGLRGLRGLDYSRFSGNRPWDFGNEPLVPVQRNELRPQGSSDHEAMWFAQQRSSPFWTTWLNALCVSFSCSSGKWAHGPQVNCSGPFKVTCWERNEWPIS